MEWDKHHRSKWTSEHSGKKINLPLLVFWAIWIARNHILFNNKPPNWHAILTHTIADFNLLPVADRYTPAHVITPISIDKTKP